MMRRSRHESWYLLVLLLGATAALAGERLSGESWVTRMARAIQTLDYEGTFIYSHNGELETMYIVHRVDENGERERLVSLSGSPREIVRHNDRVTCYFADERSVLVEERLTGLFPSFPRQFSGRGEYYDFVMLGSDRVAGLDARVLDIRPSDGFRYGYRIWLEEKSGMLLRWELIGERELPIEQMMFTSIRIGGRIPDNALNPVTRTEGFTWHRGRPDTDVPGTSSDWTVNEVPPGFELVGFGQEERPGEDGPLNHLVFSDGLASVSVYVERTGTDESVEGYSVIGGLSLFSLSRDDHQVTVVGEVPRRTVEIIARSVERLRIAGQ